MSWRSRGGGPAAAFALTRVIRGMFYGGSSIDPATFIAVTALLALVTFLACLIPARHATRVDSLTAIRS